MTAAAITILSSSAAASRQPSVTALFSRLSPSPNLAGPWLLGFGPKLHLSHGKQFAWQIGPAGVFGYLADKWIAGLFPQQWLSVGGPGSQTVSQMNIQYFFQYFPGDGWGWAHRRTCLLTGTPKSGNDLTFPIGAQISKVIRIRLLPVKLAVRGQYMPVHPGEFGQKWNLQFAVTPVIPKLIKENLFGD